ncbi:peptidoglycan-binding protein [Conyzicola nivalis]|uniref:Peptidoglycan-binding protein n=1 Tax=Conyzicola nivalis TaxID=1477021 RepID=A0A916WKW6_9MICO|nr:peptidoglycan-binding protein [Conyzicola nivalis]GGB07787.1 peptidoglycan-binding protein [Conyzicola nivalis]
MTISAVLLIAAVLAVLVIRADAAPERKAGTSTRVSTAPVTTGNMVATTNARATLHYSGERALTAAPSGVVTALPSVGAVIAPGGTLYRVNNAPVILLRGSLPAWRSFETGMQPGEDVRQLEQNLGTLGMFRGDPDVTFTKATAAAVSTWQKSLGVERTGRLDRTAILFADHDLRAAQATAVVGAEVAAGATLYTVSATTKIVDLDLRLADQQLAVVGAGVGITLPDGTTTPGLIESVGEPVERGGDDRAAEDASATFVLPVTVTVADQAAVGAFSRASVSVQFTSALADGVLTVPVEALVATDATSFAVETPGAAGDGSARRIPVTIGAFASGRVQISGEGIREGLAVVVPAS